MCVYIYMLCVWILFLNPSSHSCLRFLLLFLWHNQLWQWLEEGCGKPLLLGVCDQLQSISFHPISFQPIRSSHTIFCDSKLNLGRQIGLTSYSMATERKTRAFQTKPSKCVLTLSNQNVILRTKTPIMCLNPELKLRFNVWNQTQNKYRRPWHDRDL